MRVPASRPLMVAMAAAAVLLTGIAATPSAWAQLTFYANDGFGGRAYTTKTPVNNLHRSGYGDRASSVVVLTDNWQICTDANFQGRCKVLRPGQYPALAAMGMEDRISSARPVLRHARFEERQYAPAPLVTQDYRRRHQERLFEAPVTAVRAVVGHAGQRCWVERESVSAERGDSRAGGAALGAVIGGILGHQVGGGSGKDIATAGGVVAGAVVGSNLTRHRDGTVTGTRDVQRCAATPAGARPDYWDVSYRFRNKDYSVQLTQPPGATITVNRQGEPRA